MASTRYYAMISSLPYLPYFEQAERLPINEQRMEWRRSMLEREDRVELRAAAALVRWRDHSAVTTDEQVVRQYQKACQVITNAGLRGFLDYRMGLRSAVAALRRRHRGEAPPGKGEVWGAGLGAAQISSRWGHADFQLSALFPWLPEARVLLEHGDAVGLERLLASVLWRRLTRIAEADPFGFEALWSYFFRWDIVRRWMKHDADAAKIVFQDLVREVTREHQQIFAS